MAESEHDIQKKLLEELLEYVKGNFISPTLSPREMVQCEKEKIQEICRMAYENGFSDTLYIVDAEYHEETKCAEFNLTKHVPLTDISLMIEDDKDVIK